MKVVSRFCWRGPPMLYLNTPQESLPYQENSLCEE